MVFVDAIFKDYVAESMLYVNGHVTKNADVVLRKIRRPLGGDRQESISVSLRLMSYCFEGAQFCSGVNLCGAGQKILQSRFA